jgi:DNA-binding NarL/FixJ family response regulator
VKLELSPFESRVDNLVGSGRTYKYAAKRLNVNEDSIRSAWRRIVDKSAAKREKETQDTFYCSW